MFGLCFILTACAVTPPLAPGEPAASVTAKLGRPTATIQDGQDQILEYARGPYGQQTWMARIGPDGRLLSYEQVLTNEKFATLKPGISTKGDVLRTIGHPSETSRLDRIQLEVWTYPYKENGVWDSLMHVHFDNNGVLNKLMNGPDMRREEENWMFRGFGRRH